MSRSTWIKEMIEADMSKEDIIDNIMKGSEEKGVAPMKGDDAKTFAKLNYSKVAKKMQK